MSEDKNRRVARVEATDIVFDQVPQEPPPARDLRLRYVDAEGVESVRVVTVLTFQRHGGGRFTMQARCHEAKALRSFLSARIREAVDMATGEALDIAGLPDRFTVRIREGDARGWYFGLPASMRSALDIVWLPAMRAGVQVWAWRRGNPPLLAFETGFVFFRPGAVRYRPVPWAAALAGMEALIQIVDARPDALDGARIAAGFVVFDLVRYRDGRAVARERWRCSQAEFAETLRTGEIVGAAEPAP